MKGVFYLISLLAFVVLNAQNLINNGSFESGECPKSYSKKPFEFKVDEWFAPDNSTPDYYHVCAKQDVGIPNNWASIRNPVDGDAYVGIYLKKGARYQENLGIELSEPLIKGKVYEVGFSIADAANSEFMACQISVLITKNIIYPELTQAFDYRGITLEIPSPDDYTDFSWKKFTFEYTAEGGEILFYIGSLYNPNEHCRRNIFRMEEEPMLRDAIYVFIDDVYLKPVEEIILPIEMPHYEFVNQVSPLSIYFEFDKDYLSDESAIPLDSLKEFVLKNDLHMLVTGSTDSLGTKEYNIDLGQRRAMAVKDYLVFLGIDNERIKAVSKGEDAPEYTNHSEEYRKLNRNVLIEFFKKE